MQLVRQNVTKPDCALQLQAQYCVTTGLPAKSRDPRQVLACRTSVLSVLQM